MAFAHVNPLTALWQRRGLSCLLMPEGFDAFAPRRAESTATPSAGNGQDQPRYGHAGRQPGQPGQFPAAGPARQAVQSGAQAPAMPVPSGRHTGPPSVNSPDSPDAQGRSFRRSAVASRKQAAPPPPAQGQDRGQPTATGPAADGHGAQTAGSRLWKPLAPDTWPAPWRRQLEKTRPGLVLWTYWNLGLDLCNAQTQGQMERRGFLQKLLQDLAHPAGTHTFWPASLPGEDGAEPAVPPVAEPAVPPVAPYGSPPAISTAAPSAPEDSLVPHADAFWSGASRLGARGVVVMGSAAVKALGLPSGLRPLQQARYRGHMVWVLWDVDYLQREDQRYASMLAFLRQALRQITR